MATRNISDIYNFIDYQIRKQRGVYLSPNELSMCLDAAQNDKFTEDFKSYGIDQTIHDSLKPFKIIQYQFTSASDGSVAFPDNYYHFLDGLFTVTGSTINQVSFFSSDEKAKLLTNQLRPVTLSNPFAEDSATGFQLYPQSVQTGFYNYLRRPATPIYGYTQVGRAITYNAATSVQLEWGDNYIDNIISRALAYMGLNMSENEIIQFSQLKQGQTNA